MTGTLKRDLGVPGAVLLGLGSIIGTGVFVSIGVAAGIAGSAVVLAIVVGAVVAACNALSSAQLAAAHPVAGGTYEYGYRLLHPAAGFTAGWAFLIAKSASAATAALGFAAYLGHALDLDPGVTTPIAIATALVMTGIVLAGLRRSSQVNAVLVAVSVLALLGFVALMLPSVSREGGREVLDFGLSSAAGWARLAEASALMFVAYTGYGRVATLGEEVRDPRRTIPRAIVATLGLSALLYVAVGAAAVAAVGAAELGAATGTLAAPLALLAGRLHGEAVATAIGVGAMLAMLGVLLNLVLGLSRVWLAMGRRGDMPVGLGRVGAGGSPTTAIMVVGITIAGLCLLGDVRLAWSVSAFSVLIYYAITNLCALRLPREQRLYPTIFMWIGLVACAGLAWWVPWPIWASGCGALALGLLWHLARSGVRRRQAVADGVPAATVATTPGCEASEG